MSPFVQDRCLICHKIIQPALGWRAIFSQEKEQVLCPDCEGQLEKLEGDLCKICSRPFALLDEKFRQEDLCHDCVRWEKDLEWKGYLNKNTSLYLYNDFFKEVMAKFKFRGDYELANIFAAPLREFYRNIKPDCLVPIPLSEERLYERGFNQAEALLFNAGLPVNSVLSRIHLEKQSKKSRLERIHIPQVFRIENGCEMNGKSVLLIDDIYTTGSTLRHAAKLLKEAGATRIESLTLAR